MRITRKTDGSGVLHCTRDDGSVTWQVQSARQAGHFGYHDLRHYAVETILEFGSAFFGLIASGWDIDDTTGKGKRGPIPLEAAIAEQLVGMLDREQLGGASPMSAAEVNHTLHAALPESAIFTVSDAQLAEIRSCVDGLLLQLAARLPGEAFELEFPRRDVSR